MEHTEHNPATRAILAGLDTGEYDAERSMDELWALAESDDLAPVAVLVQRAERPDPGTYLGRGKLKELADLVQAQEAHIVVMDGELTGTQQKNCEDALGCEVLDRTMLILDIFARRAKTGEGKMQTELARLQYTLPRLVGMGASLSRQGGGGGGGTGARRGAGESRLETDRRHIRRRIEFLRQRLGESEARKDENRRRRRQGEVPVVALVGYTNVGKSSLLNALCGSAVEEKDMLFATLDPSARRLRLPDGQTVVLVDTVGFVSRLPHQLVQAFRSTLDEARWADILLQVADASDPARETQLAVTAQVLKELDCQGEPVVVYNKCDISPEPLPPDVLAVSARTGEGLPALLAALAEKLAGRVADIEVLLPYNQTALAARLHADGAVEQEEYRPDGIFVRASLPRRFLHLYGPYLRKGGDILAQEVARRAPKEEVLQWDYWPDDLAEAPASDEEPGPDA